MPSVKFFESPQSGNLLAPATTLRGAEELSKKLGDLASKFPAHANAALKMVAELHRSYMVMNMLSGQRLHRRSGTLAGAWRVSKVSDGVFSLNPGQLLYSRVHEFGFNHPFQFVRAHTRRGVPVAAYFRDMDIKETRYVRDTIKEAEPLASSALEKMQDGLVKSNGL